MRGEPFRLGEGEGEQDVGGFGHLDACGALLVAEGAAEAAQIGGVHSAERGGEQGEGGLDADACACASGGVGGVLGVVPRVRLACGGLVLRTGG